MSSSGRTTALAIFLLAALINLGLEPVDPSHRLFFLRGIPVWALAARLLLTVPFARARWIFVALVLGSLGDIVLAARSETHAVQLFLSGMGLFLVGHLFYIAAFVRDWRPQAGNRAAAAAMITFGLTVGALLFQALGAKAIPMLVYACALCGMGTAAALRSSRTVMVLAGAALFILSDALIAVHQFMTPLPLAGLAILTTYWAAQFLIAEGWADDQTPRTGQLAMSEH